MEMPEGWKRLETNSEWVNEDMQAIEVRQKDVHTALDLMKEMAEALDGIAYDLTDKKIPETEGTDLCMIALRKFELWK